MVLVLIFRNKFSIIYTSDVELQHAVSKIAGLLGLTMVLNSVQQVISGMLLCLTTSSYDFVLFMSPQPRLSRGHGSGVAIGGGWQGLVAYINLGCYYVFGLPLGYLLGYKFNYGVIVIDFVNLNCCNSQKENTEECLRFDFVMLLTNIFFVTLVHIRGFGLACFAGLHFRH
jgi:MATE family multidrug resistance protein